MFRATLLLLSLLTSQCLGQNAESLAINSTSQLAKDLFNLALGLNQNKDRTFGGNIQKIKNTIAFRAVQKANVGQGTFQTQGQNESTISRFVLWV